MDRGIEVEEILVFEKLPDLVVIKQVTDRIVRRAEIDERRPDGVEVRFEFFRMENEVFGNVGKIELRPGALRGQPEVVVRRPLKHHGVAGRHEGAHHVFVGNIGAAETEDMVFRKSRVIAQKL